MKKRLAILIYSLGPGGAERVVSVLLPELIRHYEVTLVLMNETIFYEIPNEVKVEYLEKSRPEESGINKLVKLPLLGWRYRKFLRKRRIDISLSFMNRPNYVNVLSRIFGSGVRTMISERIAPSREYSGDSARDRINRTLIGRLYQRADRVVPNSRWTAWELNRRFGIPEEKIRVVYNPVDLEKIDRLRREEIAIEKTRFTFVMVGRFEKQKNHKLLIEAFHRSKLDAELWLIGDGPLRRELEEVAAGFGIERRVRFLGRQKNPYKYLTRADCFVFSTDYEGFPNVLLEAEACELPVVSTDCRSGPREILAPGTDFKKRCRRMEMERCGILVPVGDVEAMARAMEKVYNDADLRRQLVERSRQCVQRFANERIVRRLLEVLEEREEREG